MKHWMVVLLAVGIAGAQVTAPKYEDARFTYDGGERELRARFFY